jgi:hypothetical protein
MKKKNVLISEQQLEDLINNLLGGIFGDNTKKDDSKPETTSPEATLPQTTSPEITNMKDEDFYKLNFVK